MNEVLALPADAAWLQAPIAMGHVDLSEGRLLSANPALQSILASRAMPAQADLVTLLGDHGTATEAWAHLRAGRPWRARLRLGTRHSDWYQVHMTQGSEPDIALLCACPIDALQTDPTQLVSQLSHELRTPLNGVISLTELVLTSQLGERQRKLLDMALLSGRQLLELINHTLDLAKLDAGAMQLDRRDFALHDCLRDALQPLLASAHHKGVTLQARVQPGVPQQLVGDALRLRQVLSNLVGNALKFTAQGQVRVDVQRVNWRESAGLRLGISVTDTGMGMSPEQVRRLFKPFAQGDASIAQRFGGSGLGLVIAQRLIRLMGGGDIEVESSPGVGSCFRFEVDAERASS
jgi:signal transduction histidine kinase